MMSMKRLLRLQNNLKKSISDSLKFLRKANTFFALSTSLHVSMYTGDSGIMSKHSKITKEIPAAMKLTKRKSDWIETFLLALIEDRIYFEYSIILTGNR